MNAFFTVKTCSEALARAQPKDQRKVKQNDYDDYSDNDSAENYESAFNTISFQHNKPKVQVRASRGQEYKTWKHFIAAEEVTWDYAPHLKPTHR